MRAKFIETNKPEKYIHSVRNGESTAAILAGTPVVMNLSKDAQPTTYQNGLPAGFEDGLQVVLPATAGATNSSYFCYGVALADIAAKQLGESMVHGVMASARITVQTRGATNTSAATVASVASGQLLVLDTVNNAFVTTATLSAGQVFGILLDNIATVASKASNDSAWVGLGVVQNYRVAIRHM